MTATIIDKVNDIAFKALNPGPAAFWHVYMWEKIHAIHISHSNRGLYGSAMADTPKMMIDDVYKKLL